MKKLFNIFHPQELNWKSLSVFCLQTSLITSLGAMGIVLLARIFALMLGVNDVHTVPEKSEVDCKYFIIMVFLAPIVETIVLSLLIKLAAMVFARKVTICFISAVFFSTLHGMDEINHILGPFILFFVFSYSFVLWRTHSYRYAYISACVPHMLNNAFVFSTYYFFYFG